MSILLSTAWPSLGIPPLLPESEPGKDALKRSLETTLYKDSHN